MMEYNTTRNSLLLPEYGRNVQNMIAHAITIADRTERNRAAQAIIEVMGQLNPHLRDVDDYRHKLWTHLFVMSNFELDVESPYEIPNVEVLNEKPARMEYPKGRIRYGHYGKNTQKILESALSLREEKKKEYLKGAMANFMKYQYLAHNNGAVENHVIANQLKELSGGVLELENPDELVSTNSLLRSMGNVKRSNNTSSGKSNYGKKNYGSNGSNNNNGKKKFIKK